MLELLVVVGIICALLAILLPVIGRARDSAKQTMCLSNLRQLGVVYQLYATENYGQIPIGYYSGEPWTGYFLSDGSSYPLAGCLFKAGLLTQPDVLYCPSQVDPRWQFNTSANPYPPPLHGLLSRIGYTARPTVAWSGGKTVGAMTRINSLGAKAILADVIGIPLSSPDYTNVHHRNLNVLYADRSARPVDRASYDSIQQQVEKQGFSSGMNLYLDKKNPNAQALWNAFDRG